MTLEKLKHIFASEILGEHENLGDLTLIVKKDRLSDIFSVLKNDPDYSFEALMSVCGVDYLPTGEKPRFEVVYHFYSFTKNHRLRLRVKIPESDMTLASATSLWKSADWHERETYDMFGFHFEDHPNLRRLLMNEGFVGHPLRKDYAADKRQKIPVPEGKIQ